MPKIGPGTYEFTPAITKKGQYYNTKYGSSKSKRWNPPHSVRFSAVLSEGRIISVGPGKYSHRNASMPKDGVYICSKFRNARSRRFGKEKRNPLGLNKKKGDSKDSIVFGFLC